MFPDSAHRWNPRSARRFHPLFHLLGAIWISSSLYAGSQVQINLDSGTQFLRNFGGTLLSAGGAGDGDGTVVQLGYFDGASAGSNFTGTWRPLTGEGSLNTGGNTGSGLPFNTTSIGDIGGGADPFGSGIFGFSLVFDSSVAGTFNDLPLSTSIPLAIRFYDGASIASSTFYNTVSNDAWLWKLPATPAPLPPIINMSFDDPGLEWESIASFGQPGSSAFHTTIPVPEPGTPVVALLCLLAAGFRRRRAPLRASGDFSR
jgi:hypothetical protein